MNVDPSTIVVDTPRDRQMALMQDNNIHHLPVIDADGRVVNLISMDELLVPEVAKKQNAAVLLVGGLGSRLSS